MRETVKRLRDWSAVETDVTGTRRMSENDTKECIMGVLITRYVKSAKDCSCCLSECQSVCVYVCVFACPIKHLNPCLHQLTTAALLLTPLTLPLQTRWASVYFMASALCTLWPHRRIMNPPCWRQEAPEWQPVLRWRYFPPALRLLLACII